jgi:fibronectin-binding autotransporter adhesin
MGRGIDRIIDARSPLLKLSIRRLALIGGDAENNADQPPNPWGGAIQAFEADITLKNALVRGNHDGEFGGAIMLYRSKLKVVQSRLEGNSSDGRGGAIYSEFSEVFINRSTLRDNEAGVYGGGLFMPDAQAPPNEATIVASTFVGNSAAVGGGIALDETGIFSADAEPDVQVSNSTFAGNEATVSGGAISAVSGALLEIDNSTIAYNAADTDNEGGGAGGGLHEATSTVTVGDSIIAANTLGSSGIGGTACNGNYTNAGGNVVAQWTAPCSLPATTPSAQIGQLAGNGGPTPTISLLADSQALGAATTCPPADQRGVSRPPTGCDSGSFESPLP